MFRSVPVTIGKSNSRNCFCGCCNAVSVAKAMTPGQATDALLAIADKYEPRIRRKIIEAINNIQSGVKLMQLAEALQYGSASEAQVFDAMGLHNLAAQLGAAVDDINNAAKEGGVLTAKEVGDGIAGIPRIQVFFNQNSPAMIDFLRREAGNLITSITEDTKQNVRTTLANMYGGGNATPIAAARQLRDAIGLTTRQWNAVNNYRKFLETGDSRAFARSLNGNDERIIAAAFRNGTMNKKKIDELVANYARRLKQSRAQMISQTEAFRAANAGAHNSWQQIAQQAGYSPDDLRRYWVATNDSHTRDAHREIPDINDKGVRLDEPFKSPLGPIMYPGDPDADPSNSINCRCRVVVRFANTPSGMLPPMIEGRSILPKGSR